MNDIIEPEVLDSNLSVQEPDVIVYESMKTDLEYSMRVLKNSIKNTEALLTKLTLDMLEDKGDEIDAMTLRYGTLNASMNKDIELLHKARKDISVVITNLNKARTKPEGVKHITNNLTIETKPMSTADIIKRLKDV